MFVHTGMLHTGASECHRAGDHAQADANHLSQAPLVAGVFGDFDAAEAFHAAVNTAHAHHVKTLRGHQEILRDLGDKGHHAAASFTDMENRNAKALREV